MQANCVTPLRFSVDASRASFRPQGTGTTSDRCCRFGCSRREACTARPAQSSPLLDVSRSPPSFQRGPKSSRRVNQLEGDAEPDPAEECESEQLLRTCAAPADALSGHAAVDAKGVSRASILIAAGVNAKALSTYLGHSSIQITLDRYGHFSSVRIVDRAIAGPDPAQPCGIRLFRKRRG